MNLTGPILGLLSILIAFAIPIATAEDTCPPKELIDPCTCRNGRPTIQCNDINEMDTLISVFERSGDRRFKYFDLTNSCLKYFPTAFLQSKRIEILRLLEVKMDSVFDKNPPIENELKKLQIGPGLLGHGIEWDKLANLSKLEFLYIKETKVNEIGTSFISNVGNKKINTLYFENTKTAKLDDHVFASLKELRDLQVVKNKIKTLKRSMFSRPAAICSFDFIYNEIETLPEDLFSDMPDLKLIDLSNNKISKFTKTTFEGTLDNKVESLNIENNPITCDCSIKWFVTRHRKIASFKGTCEEPLDKKGRQIIDISKQDLDYCNDSPQSETNMLETIFDE